MRIKIVKPKNQQMFLESLAEIQTIKKKAVNMLFEEIEQEVIEKDRFVTNQIEKLKEMQDSYQTLLDYAQVLLNAKLVLPQIRGGNAMRSFHGGINLDVENTTSREEYKTVEKAPLLMENSDENGVKITHIAGTIDVVEKDRLKKLLFRATRGKALTFFHDIQHD